MYRPGCASKDLDVPTTPPPLVITLGFDPSTFDRLDRLRSRFFPADLNVVPAHLCLFHQLPGDEREEVDQTLDEVARSCPVMPLTFGSPKRTGRGFALPVEAPGLGFIHSRLARAFAPWLSTQDRQSFRPHVTLMNKAGRAEVEEGLAEVRAIEAGWEGRGDRLILWRYLGGPWSEVESYDLSGPTAADVPRPSHRQPGAEAR